MGAVVASSLLLAGCCCNDSGNKCCRKKACPTKHWHKVQCNNANCDAPDEVETVTIEAVGIVPVQNPQDAPAAPAPAQAPATTSAPAPAQAPAK